MTRGERLRSGRLRPGEVAALCGVDQSVLRHHYRAGYIPSPALFEGRMFFTLDQAKSIRDYFAGRKKYERTEIKI